MMAHGRKRTVIFSLLAVATAVAAGFVVSSCGSSTSSPSGPRSYSGAGSQWSITLNTNGTFVVTHSPSVGATADITVNGNYQSYSTGFLLLTVTSATATSGTPPSPGATAFGLEVPGTAFFLKPAGSNGNLIAMVPSGSCPTSNMNLSWMIMKVASGWTAASSNLFGTFTYNPSSGTGSVASQYTLAGTSSGSASSMQGTCSNGIISVSGGSGTDMFLNQAGGAIVHVATSTIGTTNQDQIILAMPGTSGTNGASAAGNYAGLVFDSGAAGSAQNFPVTMSLTASGSNSSGTGNQLSDVTTGATVGSGVTITLNNTSNTTGVPGSLLGTIAYSGGTTQNMACILQQNANGSGKNVLACGALDNAGGNNFFSVIFVSH